MNEQKKHLYNAFELTKGDGNMKQVMLSMVAVLIAAVVFVGMVMYTIAVMRDAQIKILTGEIGISACE